MKSELKTEDEAIKHTCECIKAISAKIADMILEKTKDKRNRPVLAKVAMGWLAVSQKIYDDIESVGTEHPTADMIAANPVRNRN